MAVFTLWAGGLGVAFAVVLVVAYNRLSAVRTVAYIVLVVLLLAAAARTALELVRPRRR